MCSSIYPFQFHVNRISAPASYLSCWCCWSFYNHHSLYRHWFFLFYICFLLLWKLFYLSFLLLIKIFLDQNSIIFYIYFRLFHCVYSVFFVASISSFLSCWFHELSSLVFDIVELKITWFLLVALSYLPPLNPSIRIYDVYGLTIGTTYQYYGHNHSYLTLNCLDSILLNKQKKKVTLTSIRPVLFQTFQ